MPRLTLRARLLAGFGIVALGLVAAGWLVLGLQRNYLLAQVDERLDRQLGNAAAAAERALDGDPAVPGRRAGMLADSYLGVVTSGELVTISGPTDDPELRPELDLSALPTEPTTVPAAAGIAEQVRVITSTPTNGRAVVLGRSLAEVDAAMSQLATTMAAIGVVLIGVVGLVLWWVLRLGLAPIEAVTAVTRRLRGGDAAARVPAFPAGTEAQELGVAFNELVDANQATAAGLRQFVADASHELRTPLTTLRGYADLHSSGGLVDDAAVADAMARIRSEAARMARLVEDLLLLAALDRGPGEGSQPLADPAQVDVSAIVSDVGSDLGVLAPDREVAVDVAPDLLAWGDRDRLTQVVASLANNALRHTPAGTPLRLAALRHSPADDPRGNWVRIEVTDAGPGVAPGDAERIFDRFYRADAARARATGGSGLGLAIAAAVVAAHGGRIGVDSPAPHPIGAAASGPGATFWVELPGRPG